MSEIFAAMMLPAIVMLGISFIFTAICPSFGSVSANILLGIFVLLILYSCWDLIVGVFVTVVIWIARVALAVGAVLLIIRVVRWIHQTI